MATDVEGSTQGSNRKNQTRETIAEQNRMNTYRILAKYRKKNMLMFGGLLASVCGIYAYSMYAVRQEDFSDFEK